MYQSKYSVTERIAGTDEIKSARESLTRLHTEILGLDEPEDYEPTKRDYDYLIAEDA